MDAQALTPRVVRRLYGSHTKCARRSERSMVCDLSLRSRFTTWGSPYLADTQTVDDHLEPKSEAIGSPDTSPHPCRYSASQATEQCSAPCFHPSVGPAVSPRSCRETQWASIRPLRRPWNPWHTTVLRHLLPHEVIVNAKQSCRHSLSTFRRPFAPQ